MLVVIACEEQDGTSSSIRSGSIGQLAGAAHCVFFSTQLRCVSRCIISDPIPEVQHVLTCVGNRLRA